MSTNENGKLVPPWSNDPALREARPRAASTVLLLREAPAAPEVYMVRRHGRSAFMGGLWVFPGGKVDASDCTPSLLACSPPGCAMRCLACLDRTPGTPLTAEAAFAFYAAAARELFEEAGVLLAKTATDAPVDTSRLNDWRRRLQDGTGAFSELLATECLTLDVDALSYLSHWITPSAEPMRFDTRFFALPLPDEQTPLFDHKETTDGAWWSGEEALAAHAAGTILLAPPTIRHLEELARHRHLASYLEEMRGREVAPILPKMVMDGETMLVVLPWDEEYEGLEGESLNLGPHPWARTGGPSRFVLRDGRFFSKP